MEPILQVKNISKEFPGVKALTDVSVDFYPGEVHTLVGENGAGKSTLIKITYLQREIFFLKVRKLNLPLQNRL